MLKVLHIITGLRGGGAETMLLKLLSRSDRARFTPTVVSLTDKGVLGGRIERLGIPVCALDMRPGVPTPQAFWRLIAIVRESPPDVVQGWMYHGNLAAQLGAPLLQRGTPVLWNIRSDHTNLAAEPKLTALVIRLGAWLSSRPVRIIVNSKHSLMSHQEILGYDRRRWCVIPNGFETDEFTPSEASRERIRRELRLGEDVLLIGKVARYHPIKNHSLFLRSAELLRRSRPDVHFVLIGDGLDASNRELAALIEASDLRGAVHLLGRREDVAMLTAGLDIATSSSRSESFSNAIGEAMSCGVPCVVTDVGDSGWIVGDTGRVVRSDCPEELAGAWSELVALGVEGRRELGRRARKRILEHFSMATIVKRYESVYEEVLRSP